MKKHTQKFYKRILPAMLVFVLLIATLNECKKTELSKNNPVTLTMWHVYGEQADSPMNKLIEDFNQSVGLEKGIIINVTGMSSTSNISNKLSEAKSAKAGSADMPDLFFVQKNGAYAVGLENLVNWNELLNEKELSNYIPEFLDDGKVNDDLYVFPVTKSTNLLFVCGTQFERFSKDTGITYDNLSDWNGFFDSAEKYYEWSKGKTFCCLDFPLLLSELAAKSASDEVVNNPNGSYNLENEAFKSFVMRLSESVAKGHIGISDLYSNTQVMTGEVMSGIGSSAAILYYNDTVTYPDNTTEPMNLEILPVPQLSEAKTPLITQGGVGLCALKTTSQKAEAAAIFAKWLTEPERNLEFAAVCGYMPVTYTAFEKIKTYDFKEESYNKLYTTLNNVINNCTAVSEQENPNYYSMLQGFYSYLRENQKDLASRYNNGKDIEKLKNEIWTQLEELQ